jgi:DNA-binding transcriptional MerR regulator
MYTPREVAAWLAIAPVTLRKWAIVFQLWLSPAATRVSRGVARRYTDADLVVLSQVQGYLARNFTYAEVQTFFVQKPPAAIATSSLDDPLATTRLISAASHSMRSDLVQRAPNPAVLLKGQD